MVQWYYAYYFIRTALVLRKREVFNCINICIIYYFKREHRREKNIFDYRVCIVSLVIFPDARFATISILIFKLSIPIFIHQCLYQYFYIL